MPSARSQFLPEPIRDDEHSLVTLLAPLYDQMPESVAVYTREARLLYVNPVTERIFGRARAALVGQVLFDLFPEAVGNSFHQSLMRVAESGQPERLEHYYPPSDRWYDNQIYRAGEHVWVIATDITETKRAAEAERRARTEAERTAALARSLQEVTSELGFALSRTDICNLLLQRAGDALGAHFCGIWARGSDEAETLELTSMRGAFEQVAKAFGRMSVGASHPLADSVRTGRAIWLSSWEEYAQRYPESELGARSVRSREQMAIACLPLQVEGRALGAVAFTFTHARPFEEKERWFIQILVQHTAQALARSQLFEEQAVTRARLEAVVQASPAGIVLLDLDGTVRLWNPAAERMFGWRADEVLGRFLPVVPPDGRAEVLDRLERIAKGHEVFTAEAERLTRHRGIIDVALFSAPVRVNGERQCLTVVTDITEQKRTLVRTRFLAEAGALLATSLDYERTLAALTQVAVPEMADWCAVDLLEEGERIRRVSLAHQRPERVKVAEQFHAKYPFSLQDAGGTGSVLRTGRSLLMEELSDAMLDAVSDPVRRADTRELGIRSFLIVPLRSRGRVMGALTLAYAESNRRYGESDLHVAEELAARASSALERALLYREAQDAIRARDIFLSIASHELNTPLTAAKLNLDGLQRLLAAQNSNPARLFEVLPGKLGGVQRQLSRLSNLIRELLDVSRITTGQLKVSPEPMDLAALLREIVGRNADEIARAGCSLELSVPESLSGRWDPMRLDQVIQNLLSNALKYGQGRPVILSLEGEDDRVALRVRDEGIGISPEGQRRLFQRFERLASEKNYSGFGLGLWIVKNIVDAMQGTIAVESALGAGATFTVQLPRSLSSSGAGGAEVA